VCHVKDNLPGFSITRVTAAEGERGETHPAGHYGTFSNLSRDSSRESPSHGASAARRTSCRLSQKRELMNLLN